MSYHLNSVSNMRKDNQPIFKVVRDGKVAQVYSAEALAMWLKDNVEYPHKDKPTPEELQHLKELVPGFKPKVWVQAPPPPNFYEAIRNDATFQPASTIPDITNLNALRSKIYRIFDFDFSAMYFETFYVTYKGTPMSLSTQRGRWLKKNFYSNIRQVLLTHISVAPTNTLTLIFKVTGPRQPQMIKETLVFSASAHSVGTFYEKMYAIPAIPPENIVIYSNLEGEIVLEKPLGEPQYFHEIRSFDDIWGSAVLQPPRQQPGTLDRAVSGGSARKKYKGRSYAVHTGSRGGKYIVVLGKKVYV